MFKKLFFYGILISSLIFILIYSYFSLHRIVPSTTISEMVSEVKALIKQAKNDVRIKKINGLDWVKTGVNGKLYGGDFIRTSSRSAATLVIDKGNKLEIGEDSLAQLSTKLVIKKGNFLIEMKDAPGSEISIRTPDGDLTIRGKREVALWIAGIGFHSLPRTSSEKIKVLLKVSEEEKKTLIEVLEGKAEIKTAGSPALALNKGDKVTTLEVLSQKRLSPPENLFPCNNTINEEQLTFSWEKVSETKSYKIYISKNVSMSDNFKIFNINSNILSENLEEGNYHWRVCSIAEEGATETCSSICSFSIKIDKTPPKLEVEEIIWGE